MDEGVAGAELPADRRLWCESVHPDDPTVHPGGHEPFRCPVCSRPSSHPDDIRDGYCVACHDRTGPGYLGVDDRAAGFAAVVDELREDYLRVRPDPWAGAADFAGEVSRHVQGLARERVDRLDQEARELLGAGVAADDLVVVTSPRWPDSRVMTRQQEQAHADDLRRSVTAWATREPDPVPAPVKWADLAAGAPMTADSFAAAFGVFPLVTQAALDDAVARMRPALDEAVRRVGVAGAACIADLRRALDAATPAVRVAAAAVLDGAERAARELSRVRLQADLRARLGPAIQPIALPELDGVDPPRRVPGDRPASPALTTVDGEIAFWWPDGSPVVDVDPVAAAVPLLSAVQQVALRTFFRGGVRLTVSTVFLVSGWAGDVDPDLWEVAVFHAHRRRRGLGTRGQAWRFGSREAAVAGHRAVCAAIAGEQRARRAAWRANPRTAPLGVARLPALTW